MNKYLLIAFFSLPVFLSNAQTNIFDSIFSGGQYRSYRLYIPAVYNGISARPLILNLHGNASDGLEQQLSTKFMPIADTANFLMVYPNASYIAGERSWNAASLSALVNEVAFLSDLIDSLSLQYTIDLNRVYCTGMSNGGFMCHTLACELSHKITAIASVSGGIFTNQYGANCHPVRPVPVMEIHGTADSTAPYAGNLSLNQMPIDSVLNYWVSKNDCSLVPLFSSVPDMNTTDSCTAERYLYSGGLSGSTVELFKIIGGKHAWPGFPYIVVGTNMDINASKQIWRFFRNHHLSAVTGTADAEKRNPGINVFPNPVTGVLYLNVQETVNTPLHIEITDLFGRIVLSEVIQDNAIPVEHMGAGVYFITVKKDHTEQVKIKFVKL